MKLQRAREHCDAWWVIDRSRGCLKSGLSHLINVWHHQASQSSGSKPLRLPHIMWVRSAWFGLIHPNIRPASSGGTRPSMRGFAKAAALLSSTLTSALVIPHSTSTGVHRADPTVEYGTCPQDQTNCHRVPWLIRTLYTRSVRGSPDISIELTRRVLGAAGTTNDFCKWL
jgi:hypothetical protein